MKQRKKSFGMRISAFVLSFAMVCTLLAGVNVVAFAADDNDLIVSVHSFYNDATKGGDGEHLYTKDADEMSWLSSLPTWNDEDEAWKAPVSSSLAVYRVYNPNSGEHHYAAADEAEWLVSQGWTQEKIAFYSDDNMGVPVYRLWNGGEGVGSHYYTTDEGEAAYLASIGWTAEGVNFYGVKEEEPGEKEMTAVQSGSNTIDVTLSDAPTGTETFTVKKGNTTQSVADVSFAGNVATITLDNVIREAEYTVTCSDEEYEPATFIGEEAELDSVFVDDKLIYQGQVDAAMAAVTGWNLNDYYYAVGVLTLDQFGDAYEVDAWDSQLTTVPGANMLWNSDGIMVINSGANALTVGQQYTLSLVSGTTVGTGTFTVSAASVVKDMSIGELEMTEEEEEVNLTGRVDGCDLFFVDDGYYFPVVATDQYGYPIKASSLNDMVSDGTLIVSPENGKTGTITTTGTKAGEDIFTELDDGTIAMFVTTDSPANVGIGQISLVSTSGSVSQAQTIISPNEMVQTLTITPESTLIAGSDVDVEVTATNNFGEEIDMYEEVTYTGTGASGNEWTLVYAGGDDNSVCLVPATVEFADASTIKATKYAALEMTSFEINAAAKGTLIGTVICNPLSASSVKFTVAAPAEPTDIVGFTSAVNLTVKNSTVDADAGTNVETATNVIYADQYGNIFEGTQPAYQWLNAAGKAQTAVAQDDYFYVISNNSQKAATDDGTYMSTADGKIHFGSKTGSTIAVTDKYTLTLFKAKTAIAVGDALVPGTNAAAINSYGFSVTEAAPIYTKYTAELESSTTNFKHNGQLYTGLNSTDEEQIVVYGYDKSGNKVKLTDAVDYDIVLRTNKAGLATIAEAGGLITVNAGDSTTPATGVVYADIYTADGLVASCPINYSNATPATITAICVDVTDNNKIVDYSNGLVATNVYWDTTNLGGAGTGADNVFYLGDGTLPTPANMHYAIQFIDQYGLSNFDGVMNGFTGITANTDTAVATDDVITLKNGEFAISIEIK